MTNAPRKPLPLNDAQAKKYAQQYAKNKLLEKGYGEKDWLALKTLWSRESKWDYNAQNPNSSAFGIPQMLKMSTSTPLEKQIDLGMKYIERRYKTPSEALAFHNRNGWY